MKFLRHILSLFLAVPLVAPTMAQAQNTTLTSELRARGVVDTDGTPTASRLKGEAATQVAALRQRSIGNIATRILNGRIANPITSLQATSETAMASACPSFSAVRVIIAMGNNSSGTAASVTMNGAVAAIPDLTAAGSNAATWKFLTKNGANQWAADPAPTSSRVNWIFTDWIPLSSVARTDGGMLPLLQAIVHTTAGNIVVFGGGLNFNNWLTHPSGRIFRMRILIDNNDYTLNSSLRSQFNASASTAQGSPVAGMQVLCDSKVVTLAAGGDSITSGSGGTYQGEGFGLQAAINLQAANPGVAYEFANLGWSGQSTPQIRQNIKDYLTAVAAAGAKSPDVMAIPAWSPNSVGGDNTITATTINGSSTSAGVRGDLAMGMSDLAAAGVEPIVWTGLPTNTAARPFGASDALRRAYNDTVRQLATRGVIVVDFGAKVAGANDGAGQQQAIAGALSDEIHPSDTTNRTLLAPLLERAVNAVIPPPVGGLFGYTAAPVIPGAANDNTRAALAA